MGATKQMFPTLGDNAQQSHLKNPFWKTNPPYIHSGPTLLKVLRHEPTLINKLRDIQYKLPIKRISTLKPF